MDLQCITWRENRQQFVVQFKVKGRSRLEKRFKNLDEAIAWRDETRRKLGGDYMMTHHEVAQALGLHHSTVKKIERKALFKCKQWCQDHGYDLEALLPEHESDTAFDRPRVVRNPQMTHLTQS